MSKLSIKQKNLQSEKDITEQYVSANSTMREVLIKAGAYPKHLLNNESTEVIEHELEESNDKN